MLGQRGHQAQAPDCAPASAPPGPGLSRAPADPAVGDLQEEVTSGPLRQHSWAGSTSCHRVPGSGVPVTSSTAARLPGARLNRTRPLTSTEQTRHQRHADRERGRWQLFRGDGPSPGAGGKASEGISGTAHSASLPNRPSEQPRTTGPAPAGTSPRPPSTQAGTAVPPSLTQDEPRARKQGEGAIQDTSRVPWRPGGLCGTRAGPLPRVRGRKAPAAAGLSLSQGVGGWGVRCV